MNILAQINAAEMIEIIGLIVLPVFGAAITSAIWMSKRFTRLEDQIADLPCVKHPNVWCDSCRFKASAQA